MAWSMVAVYTLVLYGTLTIAYDIYISFYRRLGEDVMSTVMFGMYVPVGVALIVFLLFCMPLRPASWAALALIGLCFGLCLALLEIPAKRFHFMQYAPLTVLVFDALRFRVTGRRLYVLTLIAVVLIGLGDELLQGLLPNRSFGLLDVAINSAAALCALALIGFVIGEENYPRGRPALKTPAGVIDE